MNKVLICEDMQSDIDRLQLIVATWSKNMNIPVQILIAKDGLQAINLAKTNQPKLILMDVNMTGMDGFQATREILATTECASANVVFVTSKNQRADVVWAKMLGAKGFITKPYTPESINTELDRYVK